MHYYIIHVIQCYINGVNWLMFVGRSDDFLKINITKKKKWFCITTYKYFSTQPLNDIYKVHMYKYKVI